MTTQETIRPGYKQTEVGVIPEDWDAVSICSVARLESGHTPSKRVPAYWDGPIPWVSLHDSEGLDELRIESTEQTVSQEGIDNSSARILPEGTVVFSRTATVGKCTILACPMATSQDFANYICGPELYNEFLVYLFRSMSRRWKNLMAGSIHNTIYMPVFQTLKIPLPPISEQRSIAEALGDADARIAALEALIAKKRDLKQATMQQLLTGKNRLPGFSKNWNDVPLGDLFIFKNGLNKAKEFFGHGSPIINYMDVFGSAGIKAHEVLGKVSVTTDEIRTYGAQKGDVFFTRTSETTDEIGISSVLLETVPNCVFSGFVLRARPKNQMLEDQFKQYCFSSRHVRDQIIASASYTTRALTNGRNLSSVRMAIPETDEQIAIAEVLSDMDDEITALEAEAEKARAIKQGMTQILLTGKTRLV